MRNAALQVEPLTPSWIQALLPFIKEALIATTGRKSTVKVVITFNAHEPDIAHWNQTTEQRLQINLLTRLSDTATRALFSPEPPDVSYRRAIASIIEEGGKVREAVKVQKIGCRQLVLDFKEGRLTGVQEIRSVPIRNQKR